MKALLLEAEWKPREGYRLNSVEIATRSSYNGNQTYYNPQAKMIDMPVPKPGAQQVLVKVKATGVCGSDVHMYQRDEDNYMAYPGHCRFPCVLGHEWSGEVVELGAGVTSLKVGDMVAVEEMEWCGRCTACRSGLFDQCTQLEEIGFTIQGAYAEYVTVPEKHCWSINAIAEAYGDKTKAYEIGAMVEPCCVAYNGIFISAGGFLPGSNVVVAGCGPVGLMGISLARASGAAKVIVMEPSAGRREMAKKMGADYVFDPTEVEKQGGRPADTIMEITNGDGAMVCIEAAAAGVYTYPIFEEVLTPSGKIVQCGMGAKKVPVSVLRMQWQRLHIHGSVGHSGGIFPYAIRLLAAKRMDLSPMVTSRFPLDKTIEAIQTAEKLQDAKVMVIQ
ncbi:MAG: scyllo-inosose 3-dehydrogenase [Armatimonadota bacterium]